MLLGAFVLSLLLWGSGLKEQDLSMYTYIVHGIAAAFGGLTAGRRATNKGWYQGSLTGIFYGIIVLLIGFLALDSSPSAVDLLWVLAAAAIGALGGMFGVNLQKS
jgi:putative membrane protein (TIGR04086 family)